MAKKEIELKPVVQPVVQRKSAAERINSFGVEKALALIEDGELSYKKIGALVGCTGGTVREWLEDNHGEQYARAVRRRYENLAESIIDITDTVPSMLENGATDSGGVAHQRLRMDARRWLVSKMLPKVYGDKLVQEITGANGGAIKTEMQVSRKLSREELAIELSARGLPQNVLIINPPIRIGESLKDDQED